MTSLAQEAAKRELKRRNTKGEGKINTLLSLLSPIQKKFVQDEKRFKIARCGRRAGKTFCDAIYLILICLGTPYTPTLYLGLTRDSAKEAIWDILLTVLEGLDIQHEVQTSNLRIKFPNGSFIQLFGADVPNARNRLRGRKFKLVICDETGFYRAIDELIYTLLPTLADYAGVLVMTSSPGEILAGLFYEADQGDQKDNWARYHWTMYDNPHFQKEANDKKFKNRAEEEFYWICTLQFGGNEHHPAFRREYWGKWVQDATSLVYPYSHEKNVVADLYPVQEPMYGIGIDLGSVSSNAIVVLKFSHYTREVQLEDSWKKAGLLIDELAEELKRYMDKYKPVVTVADTGGYGKAVVEELVRRYSLAIQAADKHDKAFHQRIVANDLLSGYIKVKKNDPILKEWDLLTKDANGEEIKGPENHLADAFLYIYRRVYQTHLKNYVPELSEEQRMIREIEQTMVKDTTKEWWEQ